MADCKHEEFQADVGVARVWQDGEGKGPLRFMAEIRVECTGCGTPMLFRCEEVGILWDRPTVDPLAQELRVPLVPKGEEAPEDAPGFVMRMGEAQEGPDWEALFYGLVDTFGVPQSHVDRVLGVDQALREQT